MNRIKQETIADIVAEMRQRFEPYAKSDSNDARYVAYLGYAVFADRIEAAAKREVAELRECLKETMVDAVAEYKNNSCFKNIKCGEIKRCDTCKVMKWRKVLKGANND